jgi:hypothetical protein
MKFSYLLLPTVVALVNSVYATLNITELLTDTPKCAVSEKSVIWPFMCETEIVQQLSCVLDGITKYNCSLTTLDTCLCPNVPMQSELSTCVQTSCEFQDQVCKFLGLKSVPLIGKPASSS